MFERTLKFPALLFPPLTNPIGYLSLVSFLQIDCFKNWSEAFVNNPDTSASDNADIGIVPDKNQGLYKSLRNRLRSERLEITRKRSLADLVAQVSAT